MLRRSPKPFVKMSFCIGIGLLGWAALELCPRKGQADAVVAPAVPKPEQVKPSPSLPKSEATCLSPDAQQQIFGKAATCSVGGMSSVSSPSPSPSVLMKPNEKAKFLSEFTQAQKNALKAANHRIDLEFKQLKQSQKLRQAKWMEAEKAKRREFFAKNTKPSDRKAYVKDYYKRWSELLAELKEEKKAKQMQCDQEIAKLKEDNSKNLNDCRASLDRGEVPPSHLWPQGG